MVLSEEIRNRMLEEQAKIQEAKRIKQLVEDTGKGAASLTPPTKKSTVNLV